jgi:type IV pilus assembly protein PilE
MKCDDFSLLTGGFMVKKLNTKGFTLVEVIVVAVIVAVLALVAIQLYQGYVKESRQNTAENLAASAAGFLQAAVNANGVDYVDGLDDEIADGAGWEVELSDSNNVYFNSPANATVTKDNSAGTVSATVKEVGSTGTYKFK